MDPLITNGVDSVLLGGLGKRGDERDPTTQRKRVTAHEKPVEEASEEEEPDQQEEPETPKHAVDDLA
ncbi:MAG: hypothetical protein WBV31_01855 [Terriglobales bacterium]|jgi:hypothetical protein